MNDSQVPQQEAATQVFEAGSAAWGRADFASFRDHCSKVQAAVDSPAACRGYAHQEGTDIMSGRDRAAPEGSPSGAETEQGNRRVETLDRAVRGQRVTRAEADHMNAEFDGHVGIRLHFPIRPDGRTGLMVVLHGWGGHYHQYDECCPDWADRFNLVTLQVNYRKSGDGSPVYDFGKYQAIDVLRAMDYVLSTYRLNPGRIIGWGGSGGGDVILQAGKMAPNTFACIVECAGITKPTNASDLVAGYTTDPAGGWQAVALGAGRSYTVAEYQVRNPQYHTRLLDTRIAVLHGDSDEVVSVRHACDMVEALRRSGKDVSLDIIEGGSHTFQGAADASEDSRFKATNKYASDLIGSLETDGHTDFERRSTVALPTEDGTYLVDYRLVGDISLRYCPRPQTRQEAGGHPTPRLP